MFKVYETPSGERRVQTLEFLFKENLAVIFFLIQVNVNEESLWNNKTRAKEEILILL